MIRHITFDEVAIKATAKVMIDGKKRQRTRKFYQIMNPWNKNADGFPKNRQEIMAELLVERDNWLAECAATFNDAALAKAKGGAQ